MSDIVLDIITDILGEPKSDKSRHNQYQFNCPVCSAEKGVKYDGKYNLEINLNMNVYNCWSCQDTHGSIKKLISIWGNRSQKSKIKSLFLDEIETNIKNDGDDIETYFSGLPKEFLKFELDDENDFIQKNALNYLLKRGITKDIIKKYGIGYCFSGKYSDRIIVPSFDIDGNVNYFIARSYINNKFKYLNPDSDKTKIIFNEKFIQWDSTIYLVEGVFDHLIIPNSIPMLGKVVYDHLLRMIYEKANADIVILLDGDAWNNAISIYSKLNIGKFLDKVRIIKLPNDYDVSEINQKLGRVGLVKVLSGAFKLKEHLV